MAISFIKKFKGLPLREQQELLKDLEEGTNRKIQSCIVNGIFRYDKMHELIQKGQW